MNRPSRPVEVGQGRKPLLCPPRSSQNTLLERDFDLAFDARRANWAGMLGYGRRANAYPWHNSDGDA